MNEDNASLGKYRTLSNIIWIPPGAPGNQYNHPIFPMHFWRFSFSQGGYGLFTWRVSSSQSPLWWPGLRRSNPHQKLQSARVETWLAAPVAVHDKSDCAWPIFFWGVGPREVFRTTKWGWFPWFRIVLKEHLAQTPVCSMSHSLTMISQDQIRTQSHICWLLRAKLGWIRPIYVKYSKVFSGTRTSCPSNLVI